MIKIIGGLSSEVIRANLRVLLLNVSLCFEPLSNILRSCGDIVLGWMDEEEENLAGDYNFYFLLATTMRAQQSKNWFKPDDMSE